MLMPAAPKMQKNQHGMACRKGKVHMTPVFMVHPREMHAMKAPTRGAQAIHLGAMAIVRPLLSQCRVGKGFDVEGNRDEMVQVVTDHPDDQIDDVPAAYQGAVRDCLDSQLQACHDSKRGTDRDDGNHHRGSAGQLVLSHGAAEPALVELHSPQGHTWSSGAS